MALDAASYEELIGPELRVWTRQKKGQFSPLDAAVALTKDYWPLAALAFAARWYLQRRKKQQSKAPAAPAAAAAASGAAPQASAQRKPRREYKITTDPDGPLLVNSAMGEFDEDEEVDVQPHENVMEGYTEEEVEAAGEAAGGGKGNNAMLQMLQQMGYRVIVSKDGSGQVFLVPPGAKAPGEETVPEGEPGRGRAGGGGV